MDNEERKAAIVARVQDLASDLLYYDRKEDDEIGIGAIEQAEKDGLISKLEIVSIFRESLIENWEDVEE